jgi:serine/threonine protein kinase
MSPLAQFLAGLASVEPDELARRLWDDQRRRWEEGEQVVVEAYWMLLPPGTDVSILLDLIYGEFVLRQEAGAKPTIQEYQKRFPQRAAEIARQLSLYQALSDNLLEAPVVPESATCLQGMAGKPTSWTAISEQTAIGEAAPVQEAKAEPGRIAGYKIISELGQGGQGLVYRALHPTLGRDVVIKLGRERIAGKQEADALIQEGRILAELDDPGLARVYDLCIVDGRVCLVMEFIRGRDLEQEAKNNPKEPRTAAQLVARVARALGAAHGRGVVHRDIKPGNILIDAAGNPRLIDFGLARFEDAWHRTSEQTGLSGTVCYMAPEQARAEPPTPASDIFALGGVLYFLVLGQRPYEGNGFTQVLEKAQRGDWDRKLLEDKRLPGALANIIERAMAAEPSSRFATAQDFAAELERFARRRSNRWALAAGALVIATVLVLGGWQLLKVTSGSETPPQGIGAAGQPKDVAANKQRPFSLQVRVGRGKRYVDLVECAPVTHGEQIRIQGVAPAELHTSLFVRGASGKLERLASRAPGAADEPLGYPENPKKAAKLAGPAGNEIVLLCARASRAIAVDEVRALLASCAAWPSLPDDSVLALNPVGARILLKGRDLGLLTDRADPEGEVLKGLKELQTRLRPHFDYFEALVFSHRE